MIRQCCQCRRIWHLGQWVPSETVALEQPLEQQDVSHGYCEECFVKQMQIIHSLSKLAKPAAAKAVNRFFF